MARHGGVAVAWALLWGLAIALAGCEGEPFPNAAKPPPPNLEVLLVDYNESDIALGEMLTKVVARAQAAPESGEARGELGMTYEMNDFQEAAIATYAQAWALDPSEFLWPYFQSQLMHKLGDTDEALRVLDAALLLDDQYVPAWLWRGSWLRALGRFDEAIEAFERAEELGAGAPATAGIAQALMGQLQHEEALELLQGLSHINHPHIQRLLGRAYQAVGMTDEARIALARGRDATPMQWRDERHQPKWQFLASHGGRLVQAEGLLNSGQFEEAVAVLEPMFEATPEDPAVVSNLAMAHGRVGNTERAFELIEHGLNVDPEYYRYYNVLASIHYHREELETALEHLDAAIAAYPAQAWAHQQAARIYMQQRRYDEAIAAFDRALQYGPETPEQLLHQAGIIEGARERWPEAIERFERAAAIDESFTLAYIYLGRSLAEAGRFEEATSALDWAERLATHPQELAGARARANALEKAANWTFEGSSVTLDGGSLRTRRPLRRGHPAKRWTWPVPTLMVGVFKVVPERRRVR